MKRSILSIPCHSCSAHGGRRGFALVLVLGVLALIVVIIVGFLVRTTTERQAAGGYASQVTARQLGDTAVGLVQAQINHASTRGPASAWVSQPGMIRTFDVSGNLSGAFKLYSADEMIAGAVSLTADLPPPNWADQSATWIDLNEPVVTAGRTHFPILDPRAGEVVDGMAAVEGFEVTGAPGATTRQPAPMPVRWLYLLADGELVAPTGGGSSVSIPGANTDNPIIGRIAFWTDDESAKVNINTAGEGSYWDTPRAHSESERQLARFQPAQREYSRYPGHPAMTSLSTILPGMDLSDYLELAPRYAFGGSEGGTRVPTGPILPAEARLYTSVDELLFDSERSVRPQLTKSIVETRRFFLTAHSRAPETNLFNLPRIATWPVYRLTPSGQPDMSRTTAFDRLIAFCASTGAPADGDYRPYFFQRELAQSPGNDLANISRNGVLYDYLRDLTGRAIPGFGRNFSAKYGADRDQILTQIFDYVRSANLYDDLLTDGNQFTNSRGAGDVVDAGHGFVAPIRHPTNGTMGFGRFFTLSELGLLFICNAVADDPATSGTDESLVSNTAGNRMLREPFPSGEPLLLEPGQKRIQAIVLQELFSVMQGFTPIRPNMQVRIQGLDQFQINGTSLGLSADATQDYTQNLTGSSQGRSWGGNMGFRTSLQNRRAPGENVQGMPIYPFVSDPITIAAPASGGTMDFQGGTVIVELRAGTGNATELVQTLTLVVPSATLPVPELASSGTPAQGGSAPVTTREFWWTFAISGIDGTGTSAAPKGRIAAPRWTSGGGTDSSARAGALIRPEFDTLRTIAPRHGDFRHVAARPTIDDTSLAEDDRMFRPLPGYHDVTNRCVSTLTNSNAPHIEQGNNLQGRYISAITYERRNAPDIPTNAAQTPDNTGDFDTGVALAVDGPYINKPDEGNTFGLTAGNVPYFDQGHQQAAAGPTFFSPNRQIPSPVVFGSLPTGVVSGDAWRTLLFRPHPGHPALASGPRDHLLLDFFWMPVVEPYVISDRFSTAGKINMNYQILPFTYVERSAGMRSLLKAEKLPAIANNQAQGNAAYKEQTPNTQEYRLTIHADETLLQFANRFDDGEVFRAASEICDLYLVPEGTALTGMAAFWTAHRLTGDNLRERPYASLYPRLTTRSNTFTVHFRAQALTKSANTPPNQWVEGSDRVGSEYRGSTMIERYVDGNESALPDFALPSATGETLDDYYKWRVLQNRQFSP